MTHPLNLHPGITGARIPRQRHAKRSPAHAVLKDPPLKVPPLKAPSGSLHRTALLIGLLTCLATGTGRAAPAAPTAATGIPPENSAGTPSESRGLIDGDVIALHAQSTFVFQGHDGFHAPYGGPQSLDRAARGNETWDVTLYAGLHPWQGGEIWADGEIDQGFGISNTTGIAGFTSGEAYKVGRAVPYFRVHRAFYCQTVNLGGTRERDASGLNQFGTIHTTDRLVLTLGKFAVTDIFDAGSYAHDPRTDFLNWTAIDAGTFDYAADSWGYTAGIAGEWYQDRWTLRSGAFLMSNTPNSPDIDTSFHQVQADEEIEERHSLLGRPGKILVTAFLSHARMADLADAVRLSRRTGQPADAAAVRHYGNRPGISLMLEQGVTADLGIFLRAGWADGRYESYEFTDIDRSLAAGLSLAGSSWHRPDDRIGIAGMTNGAGRQLKAYLAAGGTGQLVGDGKLPHPGDEHIAELYYDAAVIRPVHATLDYQWIGNPAYNRDRGPVSVLAFRLHGQY